MSSIATKLKEKTIAFDAEIRRKFDAHRPSLVRSHPAVAKTSNLEELEANLRTYDQLVLEKVQRPIYVSPVRTLYFSLESTYKGASIAVSTVYTNLRRAYRWRP